MVEPWLEELRRAANRPKNCEVPDEAGFLFADLDSGWCCEYHRNMWPTNRPLPEAGEMPCEVEDGR